jgi:uncharacterized protein YnzC (UPF0291/DUF896 family)
MTKETLELQQLSNAFTQPPVENITRQAAASVEPAGSLLERLGKGGKIAFEENTIVSSIKKISEEGIIDLPTDPNYDPLLDIPEDKLDYISRYTLANSRGEVDRITTRINREEERRRIFAEEVGIGPGIVSSIVMGMLDPVNLIPIGGQAYKSYKIGRVAQGAARTATAGFVSSVAAEAILQQTEEIRSVEESVMNISAGTILSGILGGAASAFSRAEFNGLANMVRKDATEPKSELELNPDTQEIIKRSVGARQVVPYEQLHAEHVREMEALGKPALSLEVFTNKLESLSEGVGGSAKVITKGLAKINPLLRTFNAASTEAKVLLQELVTHNMIVGKNELGVASQQSTETAIKQWRAGIGEALPNNAQQFKNFREKYKKEGIAPPFLKQIDFNTEVSKAMRRGDVLNIQEVAASAKEFRSKVFEPLKNEAINQGLLPKDVQPETAISYLMRLWNRQAVIAMEPELRDIITKKLRDVELPKFEANLKQEILELKTKIDKLGKDAKPSLLKKLQEKEQNFNKIYEPEGTNTAREFYLKAVKEAQTPEAKLIAQKNLDNYPSSREGYIKEITDSVLSNLKGETRFNVVSNYDFKITKRGPLKERTLSFIRDEEVEKFLENDIEVIAHSYVRIMGTDVELARKFNGDVNLEQRFKDVLADYEKIASKAKSDIERVKIQKEKQQVIQDLTMLRDIMRGTYYTTKDPDSLIVRGGRIARQLNYVTKLGGVVISSVADSTRTVGVHGLKRFSKGLSQAITNSNGIKLNIKEARRAGSVLDAVLQTRLATLAELTDPLNTGQSTFEKFITNTSNLGTKLNGISLWNDIQKGFASVITQQRIVEEISNLTQGKISKTDRTYLAFLGIDPDNASIIKQQLDAHSFKEGDLWVANTEAWTDLNAVWLYRNALNQDVDRTIVTKTIGDVPTFMNSEVGKVVGQFKSFTFAATQQVLISSLQQADKAALNGFITSVMMGALVYKLKSVGAGRETSDDPRKWIAEGIDRSGYLGVIMEINNISEKVSRGTVGINPLIGGEVMSRYVNRNGVGALLGPSLGTGQDLYQMTGAILSGDIKESDVHAFRRNLPFQNVFYLQSLFNEMETSLNQTIGTE